MPKTTTPLMQQYTAIKSRYPNTVLLYRMGDFYELFNEDAKIASNVLGLTLTARNHGGKDKTPLAGFPHHALDRYSARLVKAGYKIAICEQTEDPKQAKGIVKRDVIEVVTAGTSMDTNFLDERQNNFCISVLVDESRAGISIMDISTGDFSVMECGEDELINELARFSPAEVLLPDALQEGALKDRILREFKTVITGYEDWKYDPEHAEKELQDHFKVNTLEGLGIERFSISLCAAGALLAYIKEQKKTELSHIENIRIHRPENYMHLDLSTLRNLELLQTTEGETGEGTLFSVMDRTATPMGSRMQKSWIVRPLSHAEQINTRLDAVEYLIRNRAVSEKLYTILKGIVDIERVVGRIGTERVTPRDCMALSRSLSAFPEIDKLLNNADKPPFDAIREGLKGFEDLEHTICSALVDEPPISVREGNIIRAGYNSELDDLINGNREGREWIAGLQPRERERTGINTLKVGYNKVFGYYIEVTRANIEMVPEDYIRKQTLVNGERFITPELKEWEARILGAEEKINELEYRLFSELRISAKEWCGRLLRAAEKIAELDVYCAFAKTAEQMKYVRPAVDNGDKIWIQEGRHPVVEYLNPNDPFIPNDTVLDNRNEQILLITGPNMAGKSTYLRQTAIIVLMAQIGSFVPAKRARIGIADRIFTRVGASDKMAKGQSTFLVEMTEVATILRSATPKSLVLLDEVGRGTSTFDGLSIAWAVAEHLHENPRVSAKTLFATHYHELAELSAVLPRIKNYNVQVKEWKDRVIFLRKIVEGHCDHSYGIEVAKLAGVPKTVTDRAKEILANLESMEMTSGHKPRRGLHNQPADSQTQMNLFEKPAVPESQLNILKEIKETDIHNLTPLQALERLAELKKKMETGA